METLVQYKLILPGVIQWPDIGMSGIGKQYGLKSEIPKSIQVEGNFSGIGILIEGSNTGVGWSVLHNPNGNPLLFYDSGIQGIGEFTRLIRPSTVGGEAESKITITLLVK